MSENTGLINNLVTQFGSAYDCFRELVQNSIDAGSSQIDVWMEFESSDGHVGTTRICVEDFGEGMDEAIIDNQLTKLFASSKENDLTKIGKFGIGFVSVFALKPKAVLVHTGRAGEYWEILFHEDRSYTKTRIEQPVEGTTVTLFLAGDFHQHQEVAKKTFESLQHWCRHASVDITFENRTPPAQQRAMVRDVTTPFDELSGDCKVEYNEVGTRIVATYALYPQYGLFNSGLTLAWTRAAMDVFPADLAERVAHINVKIDSRYLEHTLSRDTVMRDDNWLRACEMIEEVAKSWLPIKLLKELEELVAKPNWDLDTMNDYARLMGFLSKADDSVFVRATEAAIFRDVHGKAWTPDQIWSVFRQDGRILVSEGPSELSQQLSAMGIPVILGRHWRGGMPSMWTDHPLEMIPLNLARCVGSRAGMSFWGMVKKFFGVNLVEESRAALAKPEMVYLPVSIDDKPSEQDLALLDAASALLDQIGAGYKGLTTFSPSTTGSGSVPFFVTGRDQGELMARPPGSFDLRAAAAVNRTHPHFDRLRRQFVVRPDLASYCLAKALLLADDRLLEKDLDLVHRARLSREGIR